MAHFGLACFLLENDWGVSSSLVSIGTGLSASHDQGEMSMAAGQVN